MVKITVDADCGNSPKMQFIKQFNIAFAEGNTPLIIGSVSDDIIWTIVGGNQIEGKDAFISHLGRIAFDKTKELILSTVIAHGKVASASGVIIMNNGQRYAFSDVYQFTSAKGNAIQSIQSFMIELKG